MKLLFVIAAFILGSLDGILSRPEADLPPYCPEGQVWDACYTKCPPMCTGAGPQIPDSCDNKCVVGCRCNGRSQIPIVRRSGQIKECISFDDCCPDDMVWRECKPGSCSELRTCDKPKKRECKKGCKSQCVCPDNKPILHDGTCKKAQHCGKHCHPQGLDHLNCHCEKCSRCTKNEDSKICASGQSMCPGGKCCCCLKDAWRKKACKVKDADIKKKSTA